jgi:uncharacterized membrane protein YraQ (UPF0718 family)
MWKELLDPKSSQSSIRFAFLVSVLLSNIVMWYAWLFLSILKMELVDIPDGVVYAYAAANGISFVGKAAQSFAERKTNDSIRAKVTGTDNTEEYCG